MANLTLSIDDHLLRAARKFALDRNTSVNQLVRDYLSELVNEKDRRQAAIARLEELRRTHKFQVGEITRTRDELHER